MNAFAYAHGVQTTMLPHSNSKNILKKVIQSNVELVYDGSSCFNVLLLWRLGFRVRVSSSKLYSDSILFWCPTYRARHCGGY